MESTQMDVTVEDSKEKLANLATDATAESKTFSLADFAEADVIRVQALFRGRRARQQVSSWVRVVSEMQRMFHLRTQNARARNMLALVKTTESMQDENLRKYYQNVQNTVYQNLAGLTDDNLVVLEKKQDEQVHYTLQGNREHYSAHSMYKRQMLLRSEELRAISLLFWKVTKAARFRNYEQARQDDNSAAMGDDTLTYAEYRELFLRISKVLVPDFNDLQCEVTIRDDWQHERKTRKVEHPETGAKEEAICQEQLHHSLFELVDHWLDVIDLAAYKTFMLQLLWSICQSISESNASATLTPSSFRGVVVANSQTAWRGIELRELGNVVCYLNIVGDLAIPYNSNSVAMFQLLDETVSTIVANDEVPELVMVEHTKKLDKVEESEADRAIRLEMEEIRKLNLSAHERYDEMERRQLARFRAKMQKELEEQQKKNAHAPTERAPEAANDAGATIANDLGDAETTTISGGGDIGGDVGSANISVNVGADVNASTDPGTDIVNSGTTGAVVSNGNNAANVGVGGVSGGGRAGDVGGGGGIDGGVVVGGMDNDASIVGAISTGTRTGAADTNSIDAGGDDSPGTINTGVSSHGGSAGVDADAGDESGIGGDTRGLKAGISGTPARRGGGADSSADVANDIQDGAAKNIHDGVGAGGSQSRDDNGTGNVPGNETVDKASSDRLDIPDASAGSAKAQVDNSTKINNAGESGKRGAVLDANTPLDTPNAQSHAGSVDLDHTNNATISVTGDAGTSPATRSPRVTTQVETADESDLHQALSKINPTDYLSHLRHYWRGEEGLAEEAAAAAAGEGGSSGSGGGGGEGATTGRGGGGEGAGIGGGDGNGGKSGGVEAVTGGGGGGGDGKVEAGTDGGDGDGGSVGVKAATTVGGGGEVEAAATAGGGGGVGGKVAATGGRGEGGKEAATGGGDGVEAATGGGDGDGGKVARAEAATGGGGNGEEAAIGGDGGGGDGAGGGSDVISTPVDHPDANSTSVASVSDDEAQWREFMGAQDPHPALALAKEVDAEEEAGVSKYLVPTLSSKALQRAQASQRSIANSDLDKETDTVATDSTLEAPRSRGPPSRSPRSARRSAPRLGGGPSSRSARNSGVGAALSHRETEVKGEAESAVQAEAESDSIVYTADSTVYTGVDDSGKPLVWIEQDPTEEAEGAYDDFVPQLRGSPISGYPHGHDEAGHDGASGDLDAQHDYEYYPPEYVAVSDHDCNYRGMTVFF